jgi:hypothetical protein
MTLFVDRFSPDLKKDGSNGNQNDKILAYEGKLEEL